VAENLTGTSTSSKPKNPHIEISLKYKYKIYFLAIFEYSRTFRIKYYLMVVVPAPVLSGTSDDGKRVFRHHASTISLL
jgi:hypothetical protein